jgi:desulfoferrodoxin-like iron-binding protein
MKVQKVGEKFKCTICGNEVTVTKVGGGELVCCGKPMERIGNE